MPHEKRRVAGLRAGGGTRRRRTAVGGGCPAAQNLRKTGAVCKLGRFCTLGMVLGDRFASSRPYANLAHLAFCEQPPEQSFVAARKRVQNRPNLRAGGRFSKRIRCEASWRLPPSVLATCRVGLPRRRLPGALLGASAPPVRALRRAAMAAACRSGRSAPRQRRSGCRRTRSSPPASPARRRTAGRTCRSGCTQNTGA